MAQTMGYEWGSWRKQPRVIPPAGEPLTVRIEGDEVPDVAVVRDISEGGIEIEFVRPFPQAALERELALIVSLPAPVGTSIELRARARHSSGARVGLRFTRVSEPDRQLLRDYVQHVSRSESWFTRLRRRLRGDA